MNPALMTYLLKSLAAFIEIKESGVPAQLKADIAALVAEAKDSILEPQDDGTPWDEAAILAWKAEHDRLTAGIRARHGNDAA